jgi:hypothetical protein
VAEAFTRWHLDEVEGRGVESAVAAMPDRDASSGKECFGLLDPFHRLRWLCLGGVVRR